MSYNIAENDIGWRFNGPHVGKNMADLFQTIFMQSTNEACKWTNTQDTHTRTRARARAHAHAHTHRHTLMNAIGENTMHYISLKNHVKG